MTRAALSLVLAIASCAGGRRAPEPGPEPKPVIPAAPAPAPYAPGDAAAPASAASEAGPDVAASRPSLSRRLELKEPGKEPRRTLQHAFTKGSRQKLRVQIVTRLVERDQTVAANGIDAPLEATILEVRADGSAEFGYELGPIVASSAGGAPLAVSGDAGSNRLRGSATIAKSGEIRDYRTAPPIPEEAPEAELLKSLFSSVIELPPEPVGSGGRWELVLEAQSSEIAIVRTTSYELSGFAGPAIKIHVSQHEQVRMPDGGAVNELTTAPSAGEWQAQLGRVFPIGRQAMKAGILSNISGELFTEIRLIKR